MVKYRMFPQICEHLCLRIGRKFPCGTASEESGVAAAVAQVATAVWVQSLAWEFLHMPWVR